MTGEDTLNYMTPEITCLKNLRGKGFTDQFGIAGSSIVCIDNGVSYKPHEVSVVSFYRFEGFSDPDDMAIIYAIQTSDGRKGTLVDAYGVYADNEIGHFMNMIESFQKQTLSGWK
jgi:hypothetical protein